MVLVNMYRPPLCPASSLFNSIEDLERVLSQLGNPVPNIIVAGDLNFPAVGWQSRSSRAGCWVPTGDRGQMLRLLRFMDDWHMEQYIDRSTRGNSILDLYITNILTCLTLSR